MCMRVCMCVHACVHACVHVRVRVYWLLTCQLYSTAVVSALDPAALSPVEALEHLRQILTAMEYKGRIPDPLMCLALHKAGMLSGARCGHAVCAWVRACCVCAWVRACSVCAWVRACSVCAWVRLGGCTCAWEWTVA